MYECLMFESYHINEGGATSTKVDFCLTTITVYVYA